LFVIAGLDPAIQGPGLAPDSRFRDCVAITFFVITSQVTRSVQAERDPGSGKINSYWIPAFVNMTTLLLIHAIPTQSIRGNDKRSGLMLLGKDFLYVKKR
jgi:hypothetical protein